MWGTARQWAKFPLACLEGFAIKRPFNHSLVEFAPLGVDLFVNFDIFSKSKNKGYENNKPRDNFHPIYRLHSHLSVSASFAVSRRISVIRWRYPSEHLNHNKGRHSSRPTSLTISLYFISFTRPPTRNLGFFRGIAAPISWS